MRIGEVIDEAAARVPERPALIMGDERWTYAQLDAWAQRWAQALGDRGVQAGDRVALLGRAGPAFAAALIGTARAGAVSAPVNPDLQPAELAALCDLATLRAAVVLVESNPSLREIFPGALLGPEDAGSLSAFQPADAPRPAVSTCHQVCASHLADAGLVLFSSGTTGRPKPVEISHRSLSDRLGYYGLPVDPAARPVVDLLCVPLFHVAGALGVLIALRSARTVVVQQRFDAGEWLRLVEAFGVQQAFVVPTMLRRILDHPDFAKRDLGSLRSLSYGAAPAGGELVRRAQALLPHVAMSNVFGQTETLGAYAALSAEDHRLGRKLDSVGRPFPGVEVRVVDPVSGADLPDGEVGEAVVRATHHVTSQWLPTGDLVARDADGYLYVKGRLKEVINRGGEKFAPVEVEEAIRALPGVVDVAVAGIPDEELGERVGALVVGDRLLTPAAVQRHCRQRLARFKVPELVEFADALPYTALGKLPRSAVAEAIAKLAGGRSLDTKGLS